MSVSIFFCYAHEDEDLLNKLKAYLRPLQRQGLIDVWYDRNISAGSEWEREISQRLNEAQIILLLVSPDFMNSDYCYSVEMKRALERHERKEARVIPVILRPIYWQGVLGNIQALPTDAKPVVDRYWHTIDEALYDVAEGIRTVVAQLTTQPISPREVLPLLKPEAVSLLRTLTGHTDSVTSVAFRPDGHILASGCRDLTIKLWDVASGEELHALTEDIPVNSVAFSPDGHTLASGTRSTIKLWDVTRREELRTLSYPTSSEELILLTLSVDRGYVTNLAFSPDGHTLTSGCMDGTINLWDVATGMEVRTLAGHRGRVTNVVFSPDGQTLASGSSDHTIKLWNLESGKEVRTLTEHTEDVLSVTFSPDGQTLASGSMDETIKIWGNA